LLARLAERVRRILAADPGEAEAREHLPHVGPVGEAVREAAGRAEAGRIDADARLEGRRRQADVLAGDLPGPPPLHQPRRAREAELDVLHPRRLDVDVVVGVVADRVAGLGDVLEPGDALLLEGAADGEAVHHAPGRLDEPARRRGVLLRLV